MLAMAAPAIPLYCDRLASLFPSLQCGYGLTPFRPSWRFGRARRCWPPPRLSASPYQPSEDPSLYNEYEKDNYLKGEKSFTAASTDSNGRDEKQSTKVNAVKELMQKLKTYGVSGVLSYGLLNTVYYLTTFLVVWFFVAPAPGKMGYLAAVERFMKILAMVWAGSQVTKLARAGGALALAPLVDSGLSWFTVKFKFESKAKAFAVIALLCCGLALLLFSTLTLLWA